MDDLLIILGLILLNGVFSMSEVALISARKSKLSTDANRGSRNAAIALELSNQPERFLSTVQIGITLIGILTGLFSGADIAHTFASLLISWGVKPTIAINLSKVLIVTVVTYLSIVVGELVPKRIGMNMSDRIAKTVAPLMKALSIITYPLVWLLSVSTAALSRLLRVHSNQPTVTEEEIKSLVKEGAQTGEVQEVEQDIIGRALVLGDLRVESIMTVRGDIVSLTCDMTAAEVMKIMSRELHSSYPVYDSEKNDILGVISLKQLIFSIHRDNFDLCRMITDGLYIPENMKVYDALDTFKRVKAHSALVCDEYGAFCGVVTLRDILDSLVGNCATHVEELLIVRRPHTDEWLVDGKCPVYDFLAHFRREDLYTIQSYTTLGGLIMNQLKRVPITGDTILWNGFRLEVIDMDSARIDKIAVHLPQFPQP